MMISAAALTQKVAGSPWRPWPRPGAWLCFVVMLAGCRSKAAPQEGADARAGKGALVPSAAAVTKKSLKGWRVDGQPKRFPWVRAVGLGAQSGWRISASTVALPCKRFNRVFPKRPDPGDGTLVDFWVVQPLKPDGELGPWEFRSAYLSDSRGGRAMVAGGALLKNLVAIEDVGLRLEGLELALRDSRAPGTSTDFTGDLQADPCPRVAPKVSHRATSSMTVSGRKIPLHGATVHQGSTGLRVRLSSAPHACASVMTEGYDAVLELALEPDGKSLRFATLSGSWFPSEPTGSKGKESFGVKGADTKKRSRVVLTLDGSLKLMKHTLAVQATVVAKRCVEAPAAGSAKPVASAAVPGR